MPNVRRHWRCMTGFEGKDRFRTRNRTFVQLRGNVPNRPFVVPRVIEANVGILKRTVVALLALCAFAAVFYGYSMAVTFRNWPWTLTQTYTSGEFLNFHLGEDKRTVFTKVKALQEEGQIGLVLLSEAGVRADELFGGVLTEASRGRVLESDTWFLFYGDDERATLVFNDDSLREIQWQRYRGPNGP